MELHLSLPLVSSCFRERDGIVVTSIHKARIGNLCPTWSIPELHSRSNAFPHIELAVGVVTTPLLFFSLAGQDKAPCNTAVGLIIDQHQFLGCQLLHAEQRVSILVITADVREQRVARQANIALLAHVTLGVCPVEFLEVPSSSLLTECNVEISIIVLGVPFSYTLIDIGHTISTRVVSIATTLLCSGRKGDAVIIDAKALLVVRTC